MFGHSVRVLLCVWPLPLLLTSFSDYNLTNHINICCYKSELLTAMECRRSSLRGASVNVNMVGSDYPSLRYRFPGNYGAKVLRAK